MLSLDDLPLEPGEKIVIGIFAEPLEDGSTHFASLEKDWIRYAHGSYDEDSYGTNQIGHSTGNSLSDATIKMFVKIGRDFGTVQAPVPYEFPQFKDPSMDGLRELFQKADPDS